MSTRRFKWIDRDQAARDLLQLAYHAPPHVSQLAIELLQAVRSPAIVSELEAIVTDSEREMWERIYALRAIAYTPGDHYLPFLEGYTTGVFLTHSRAYRRRPDVNPNTLAFHTGLLDDIVGLADKQPSNRGWFFAVIDQVSEPRVLNQFFLHSLCYGFSPEFSSLLVSRWLKLLEQHPDLLTPYTINSLAWRDDAETEQWLPGRLNFIVEICLQNLSDDDVLSAAEKWPELRHELISRRSDFEDQLLAYVLKLQKERAEFRHEQKRDLPYFRTSPAYRHLSTLYYFAQSGDIQAYKDLMRIARRWGGNIPIRAVATYFLGKLQPQYNVTPLLKLLLLVGNDNWRYLRYPVRSEAGMALLQTVTPAVWETMVDAFFIEHRNVLEDFMLDWIAYLTDRLSGLDVEYSGMTLGDEEHRSWFRVLSEISEDELQRELSGKPPDYR